MDMSKKSCKTSQELMLKVIERFAGWRGRLAPGREPDGEEHYVGTLHDIPGLPELWTIRETMRKNREGIADETEKKNFDLIYDPINKLFWGAVESYFSGLNGHQDTMEIVQGSEGRLFVAWFTRVPV